MVVNYRAKVVRFCRSCASISHVAEGRWGNCRLSCNYQIYSSIGAPKYLYCIDAAASVMACSLLSRSLGWIRKDPSSLITLVDPI